MNPIDDQKTIIDQLFDVALGSCPEGFERATCTFEYNKFDDGSSSVTQGFEY